MRNLCDLGMGLLAGASVSDGSFRVKTAGRDGASRDVVAMALLGTFSPYVVVHESSVVKIDPAIPFDVACLVGCGVATGYGSAVRSAGVKAGEDVAVIGVGGVGTAALQGARIAGARRVFVIDPVPWKREQAVEFGATHTYADIDSATAGIADVTRGAMCRKVIVMSLGRVEGKDVESWLGITAKGDTCIVTAMGNVLASEDALEEINEGYRDMLEGRNIRGIIRYTDADR